MKVVFFINKTNGFPKSMISFMEANFPEINKSYYTIDRRNEEDLPNLSNVHRISSYKEFITNKELINDIITADKIIVSGVFTVQYILPLYGKKIMKKTYWQFWGGDYEVLRGDNLSARLKVRKYIVSKCIKNSKGIILLTEPEREIFEKIFEKIPSDKFYAVVVPPRQEVDEIIARVRTIRKKDTSNVIVIGNSATKSNQHFDIFDRLSCLDLQNVKIYCPLSYGDNQYRERVIIRGKELFGDNFVPITQYMSYEKYVEFLNSCDVGIYNLNRQQALGNISLMLNLGKKIYTSDSIKKYYEQFGYTLHSVNELKYKSIKEILKHNTVDAENNIHCYDIRKMKIYDTWNTVLKSGIESDQFSNNS